MTPRGSVPKRFAEPGVVATTAELIALGQLPLAAAKPPRRRRAATRAPGLHASRFRGRGMEFSEVRAYLPGDDMRAIDWRVTARTGRLHSKCFEEERERPVWLVVELGPSMHFGTRSAFKSVAAARAAALHAWEAYREGERVGGIIAACGSTLELPPGRTRRHLLRFLDVLADATGAHSDAPSDRLEAQLRWLAPRLRSGSRAVVVSDFYGLDAATAQALRSLAPRCELTLVHVYDALECAAPPPGRYRVSDGREVRSVASGRRSAWQQAIERDFAQRRDMLRELAASQRIRLVPLRTDDAPALALSAPRSPQAPIGAA